MKTYNCFWRHSAASFVVSFPSIFYLLFIVSFSVQFKMAEAFLLAPVERKKIEDRYEIVIVGEHGSW
jgi:hypothetical protein